MNRKLFNGQEVQEKDYIIYEVDYLDVNGDVILKLKTPETKIAELKANLNATDYQAIKFAEGVLSASEYKAIKEQRQAWRDEINELEKEIK